MRGKIIIETARTPSIRHTLRMMKVSNGHAQRFTEDNMLGQERSCDDGLLWSGQDNLVLSSLSV